jgi:hypothetical protein
MTDWNDLSDEMRRLWLDKDTLDRLLAGGIDADDAPPGYSEVARVLQAAVQASDPDELVHEAMHVALAMVLLNQPSSASTPSNGRSRKMSSKSHRMKVGGLVVVGALVGSTGLAAAGVLPDAAHDAVSNVFDRVGITIPASGDHPATSGDEVSSIATTTVATGVDKGAEISSVASGGMSQAGQHGSVAAATGAEHADAASVPTPNEGGTGTADVASDGASEAGTSTAEEESAGHSSSGSDNASVEPPVPDVAAVPTAHAP